MTDLNESLVRELRDQLNAEKESREQLLEELRSHRSPPPEPSAHQRLTAAYEERAAQESAAGAKDGGEAEDG